MSPFKNWSRTDIIGFSSLIVAVVTCILSLFTQEGHEFFLGTPNKKETAKDKPDTSKNNIDTTKDYVDTLKNNIEKNKTTTASEYEEKDTIINIPTTISNPASIGNGNDGDLNTDTNNPFLYNVKGDLSVVNNLHIQCNVYIFIAEKKGDKTIGRGTKTELGFTASSGWEIVGFKPFLPSEERGYHNKMGGFPVKISNLKEVVEQFWIKGDHWGTDIPGYTQLQVQWRPITVVLLRKKAK